MISGLSAAAFRGNGLGCHTIAALNAFFPRHNHADALFFEALTGVPFGCRSRLEDPNRLLLPQMDPDEGLDRAFALLGVSSETMWFSAEEGRQALGVLKEWLCHSPVLLGPVDMGELPYLPNPELYRGCDHYITALAIDRNGLWIIDGEGASPAVVASERFMRAWEANAIPEGRGAFTLRRASGDTLPEPGLKAILGGLRQACCLIAEAASFEGARVYLALAEQEERILSWPAGRRGLEFLIPVRGQRNLIAIALVDKLAYLPECSRYGPCLETIRDHLLRQAMALGRCVDRLLAREKGCLDGFFEVAEYEASLTKLFKELENSLCR